jgi:hypothetical protein
MPRVYAFNAELPLDHPFWAVSNHQGVTSAKRDRRSELWVGTR